MRKKILYILTVIFMFAATTIAAQDDHFYQKLEGKGYDIIDIESNGLMQFLDDRSYDSQELVGNYNYSIVKKYSKGATSRPAGITLRWDSITPTEDIQSIVVTLIESKTELDGTTIKKNFSRENVKYYYPDINKREYLLCNMCPQRYCYYKVEELLYDGRKIPLTKGKFYTDGEVRMLRVDGMYNVRDFGGWHTSFGKQVVFGRLFRGNRPDNITPTGKNDFVKNEHITADLDLRGNYLSKSPMGPLDSVEYYCTNNQRYKLALTSRTDVLARDLDIIADVLRRGGSLYMHCEHGVNRCGTLAFLIDGILGYSEADLSRDYELSSFSYGNARSKTYGDMLPVIRSYGEEGDNLAQCFYNFARKAGASEDTLDTIRCIMLGLSRNDSRIVSAHRQYIINQ